MKNLNSLSKTSAAMLAALLSVAPAAAFWHDPGDLRREVHAEGVGMVVELTPDYAQTGRLELRVALTNESDADFLVPPAQREGGLSVYLVDEAGRKVFDDGEGATPDTPALAPGATRVTELNLAKRPLLRAHPGYLDSMERFDGLLDGALGEELYYDLHVIQRGAAGERVAIEPLRIVLHDPNLYVVRENFARLHAEPMVYDPTHPIDPGAPDHTPGVVMVRFHKEVNLPTARGITALGGYEVRSEKLFDAMNILVVEVPEGLESEALRYFRSEERVELADLDRIARIM